MVNKHNKVDWKNQPYGGQAVVDGVMIKSKNYVSISIRDDNKKIINQTNRFNNFLSKYKISKVFFIRGIVNMIEMLVTGLNALTTSINLHSDSNEEELSILSITITIMFSIIMALALFKLLPLTITTLIKNKLRINSNILFNIIDGITKVIILIAYIKIIALFKDMKTLFQYHGAEHKAVHCWENYKDIKKLTYKHAKKFTTLHPRCGTSFILFVIILSILIYMLIPYNANFWMKYLYRILLLPVIIGVSYEILKLSSKTNNIILKIISQPGLLMQKITTTEPSKEQLEVALDSIKKAILHEKASAKKL